MRYFKPFPLPVPPTFREEKYDIRDFGAVEGGIEMCTEAIKKAIRTCSEQGGGHVIIPEGTWLTGPIHLEDNVDLHLEAGSLVEFSRNFYDYLPVVFGILVGNRVYSVSHFLYARGRKNIAVTGSGTFNGHGEVWWYMKQHQPGMEDLMRAGREGRPVESRVYDKPEDGVRPRMLQFVECENVLIEGVTFTMSPSWTVHPAWCRNITVRGINVINPTSDAPNTDGINFESCKRGLIENCTVSTGDDMICLKAGKGPDAWAVGIPCEDIEVRNCHAEKSRGGFTVGSETSAGIRNAYIHDCTVGNMLMGINIKTMKGRGGVIENIDFENITVASAKNTGIRVTQRYNGEPLDDQSAPVTDVPKVRNFSFVNVKCGCAAAGLEVFGLAGYDIENLYFESCSLSGVVPAAIENVKGLNVKDCVFAKNTREEIPQIVRD